MGEIQTETDFSPDWAFFFAPDVQVPEECLTGRDEKPPQWREPVCSEPASTDLAGQQLSGNASRQRSDDDRDGTNRSATRRGRIKRYLATSSRERDTFGCARPVDSTRSVTRGLLAQQNSRMLERLSRPSGDPHFAPDLIPAGRSYVLLA